MRIGIGITTHNRPEIFKKTFQEFQKVLPDNAKLVVVDDASIKPCEQATYRFNENVGIAVAPAIATVPSLGGVWDEPLTAHTIAGSAGVVVGEILSNTDATQAKVDTL